jgi:DNA-binding FrmR family transcriptional regulator
VAHTIRDKQKLLARVRRIRGQVGAIERALEVESDCERVMHLLASTRAAMAGLMSEVLEDHVRTHLVDPVAHPDALDQDAAAQLIAVIRTYVK